ncbi:MAG TPA: DUF177 domain-containing protein [Bryobacteraceae bacterium]|jgi:uncharacterized protein|nr:DUF177 domain-containing protein [Bryobacteraceae bacterium]
MLLNIKEIEQRKVRFDQSFEPGRIDFTGENLKQQTPLHVTGSAELLPHTDGEVRLQGKYSVEMGAACDRCLADARFPIDATFDLFYRPVSYIARDEEVEIDEGEAELGFYEKDGIELEDVMREQVLLALPMQRVCTESCKGICPECGKNRNDGECVCAPAGGDTRWTTLRELHRQTE